jgi:hypothetical protein
VTSEVILLLGINKLKMPEQIRWGNKSKTRWNNIIRLISSAH